MKLECAKDKLLENVSLAERLTGKNLSLPILSNILCEAKGGNLTLRATNLDMGVEITLQAKVIESGKIAVPGAVFSQLLSNIPDESNVLLEEIGGNLSLKSKKTHVLIKTEPHDEFPIIPKPKSETQISIPAKDLVSGFKAVWWSAAVSGIKPELSSVYLSSDDHSLVFAATDSFRLAEKRVVLKKKTDFGVVLIPFKNVPEIIKALEGEGEVEVGIGGGQISFTSPGKLIVSRTIEGNFPDYKHIIPKEGKTNSVVLKQDFVSAFKIANIFSDDFNQVVLRIVPKDKIFEIQTKNSIVGEESTQIEGVVGGDELTLSFNHKYISDCFQAIASDSVSLLFAGEGKPLLIKGVGDQSFQYIVMPNNR